MKRILFLALLAVAVLGAVTPPRLAFAVSPRNPYRSFNLSGVNYGSMRWERTQRQKQSSGSFNKWPVGNSRTRSSRSMRVDRFRNGIYISSGGVNNGTTQNKTMRTSSR